MKTLHRLLVVLCAISSALALAQVVGAAGPCDTFRWVGNCVGGWTFDTDAEGWRPNDPYLGEVIWYPSVTLNNAPANGVIKLGRDPIVSMYGTYTLPAGRYSLVYMAGHDNWISGWMRLDVQVDGVKTRVAETYLEKTWQVYQSSIFELETNSDIQLLTFGTSYLIDAIWIVRDTTPTPTPGAGTPTATSVPATATPRPTTVPYCQSATATPQFNNAYATQVPSAELWTVYNRFNTPGTFDGVPLMGVGPYNGPWYGSPDVRVVANSGRTTSEAGSVYVPFSVDAPLSDTQTFPRNSLMYKPLTPISQTAYLDVWGRASAVYVGQTAYLEIWRRVFSTGEWTRIVSASVPAGQFSPLHVTVPSDTEAISFAASRTDNGTGGVYVDDIYLYGSLRRAPLCGGWYVLGTPAPDGNMPDGGHTCGQDDPSCTEWYWNSPLMPPDVLDWPMNKPCPDPIVMPDNLWGYLIKNMHMFMLTLFAFFPAWEPANVASTTRGLLNSPIGTIVAIAAVFFDGRVPILMAGLIIGGQFVKGLYSIWLKIKKAIPFF